MKTFYDLTAIDLSERLLVSLAIESLVAITPMSGTIAINGEIVFDGEFVTDIMIEKPLRLLSLLRLNIIVDGKVPEETAACGRDSAVVVALKVNNYPVLPEFQRLIKYVATTGEIIEPTHYLGHNGKWEFSINEPFYRWYHKQMPWGWTV